MFSWEVCKVFASRMISHIDIILFLLILYPKVFVVHCLGSLLFDGVVCDSVSTLIVAMNWGSRLGVSHILEGTADW